MNLFKNKDDSPEIWKQKYFNLLDSQEQSDKEHQANQDLLCKTIVRFALATKGFSKSLDPHLNRIRELLKSGLQSEPLKKELEIFSNALLKMEDDSSAKLPDASILLDFMLKQYPSKAKDLQSAKLRYEQGEMANLQSLFIVLAELIEDPNQPETDLTSGLSPTDSEAITRHMIRLLESANLPDMFAEVGKELTARLLSGQSLSLVFEDAVNLLLSIKTHVLVEQQEMAEFLASLTEALAELGLKASGVNIATEEAQTKRSNLDQDVAAQMADLQRTSASATQLEPLKQLISFRLQKITQQIQAHNLQEQREKEQNQRELGELVQHIKAMESETIDLRSRLDIAQQRATRDPLTALPNRLALENRLADEIARVKRHGSPLTLAVWDIDFFKRINDSYGHKSGDKALIIIAKLLSEHCRETDFIARFGGEEFVMLLPETDGNAALMVVDKLRAIVEKSSFIANRTRVSITLSCGLTQYTDMDTPESLFVRADSALYQAKQGGRNICVLV